MKEFDRVTETVVHDHVCVRMTCNMCGKEAEQPADEGFEWGGVGLIRAKLVSLICIDGEHLDESADLCGVCISNLFDIIKKGGHG